MSYARAAARGGTANRGPSRKNPINPRPGQSSQAAARVADGKHQSVAKGGHSEEVTTLLARSEEVTTLLARIDQLTRWERPIISPLESNPSMTLESPDGVEDSLTADETKGEDSPKTSKKRRRRRKKKSTKGEEKQAALQYQLVLEQQKNQAPEKKLQEQTTKTDGLTTELTKSVTERVQRRPTAGDTVLRRFPVETDARTDSGQAEWGLRPLPAHAHGPLQRYDGP